VLAKLQETRRDALDAINNMRIAAAASRSPSSMLTSQSPNPEGQAPHLLDNLDDKHLQVSSPLIIYFTEREVHHL
jgi:hypothetical protein